MTVDSRRVVNLTPHTLVVYDGDTATLRVPPSGELCRIVEQRAEPRTVAAAGVEVPLVELRYAPEISGLPAEVPGVLLVVSRISAAALSGRADVVFPLDEVRAADGTIIGCRALGRFVEPAP